MVAPMSDLAAALARMQADFPRIKRTTAGQHGKYAAYDKILAAVRPIMAKHGFAWWSAPGLAPMGGHTEWRFVLHYVLTYLPTGETIDGSYPLAEGPPQQQGAVITYARRYCLTSVLDLEIEGDDSMDAPQRARPVRGAKVTGPEHERLRDGLHTATPEDRPADRGPLPDDENPWQNELPEDRPGSIANSQRGGMHMAFSAIGITDRAERLAMTRDILGLPDLLSSNDLSYTQAAALLLALKERTGVREGR
jgi:hypothetical protein